MDARNVEDVNFVYTGPKTLAGRYLRRFWQPVYLSSSLSRGHAVPIRVLGEDFTLFRGESGAPHLVGYRCAHRRTQLSTGWVEGDTIRCVYHGWRYDHKGQCVEQPAEPKPFCAKVQIESYPTQEQLGLIFVYLGPMSSSESPPPLPRWPELETDSLITSMEVLPCNYFQSAENIIDDAHVGFAHRASHLSRSSRAGIPRQIHAEETSFGLTQFLDHDRGVEKNHFLMPNGCFLRFFRSEKDGDGNDVPIADIKVLFWYVPIDDVSHYHIFVSTVKELAPGGATSVPPPANSNEPSLSDQVHAILAGKKRVQDLGELHPGLVRIQDAVSIVGQGVIADRENERLGRTDVAVILLRKIWLRELRAFAAGQSLTPFVWPRELEIV